MGTHEGWDRPMQDFNYIFISISQKSTVNNGLNTLFFVSAFTRLHYRKYEIQQALPEKTDILDQTYVMRVITYTSGHKTRVN